MLLISIKNNMVCFSCLHLQCLFALYKIVLLVMWSVNIQTNFKDKLCWNMSIDKNQIVILIHANGFVYLNTTSLSVHYCMQGITHMACLRRSLSWPCLWRSRTARSRRRRWTRPRRCRYRTHLQQHTSWRWVNIYAFFNKHQGYGQYS